MKTATMTDTKATKGTMVERLYACHGQGHDLRASWTLGIHKLRLRVHLDASYAFQSRGTCEVWRFADLTWQQVSSLHSSEVKAAHQGGDQPDTAALDEAVRRLIDRAAWALGVK